ncbi:MAG: hypothetical protein V7K98_03860 [Nostoc sp.]|uniref:hypothetical protein n=1 Tax=Nostoc sp. TaxID=1180 RepID=UPI002FF9AE08
MVNEQRCRRCKRYKSHLLDAAFFRATYIDLLDVNDESVIRKIANDVGLNGDRILELIYSEAAKLNTNSLAVLEFRLG